MFLADPLPELERLPNDIGPQAVSPDDEGDRHPSRMPVVLRETAIYYHDAVRSHVALLLSHLPARWRWLGVKPVTATQENDAANGPLRLRLVPAPIVWSDGREDHVSFVKPYGIMILSLTIGQGHCSYEAHLGVALERSVSWYSNQAAEAFACVGAGASQPPPHGEPLAAALWADTLSVSNSTAAYHGTSKPSHDKGHGSSSSAADADT